MKVKDLLHGMDEFDKINDEITAVKNFKDEVSSINVPAGPVDHLKDDIVLRVIPKWIDNLVAERDSLEIE